VKLVEHEFCYSIDGFFPPSVIAGFSKPDLSGNTYQDIRKALSYLKGTYEVSYLKQIHSSTIHFIDAEGLQVGDGLFSKKNNLVLTVKTADCLPIFLYSDKLDVIGMLHMGWRGAVAGILDKLNYDLYLFKVVAGVGLRQCCYQVGQEFLNYPNLASFIAKKKNGLYFDPVSFAKERFKAKGLKEEDFFDLGICSLCSSQGFFSYRRNATSGRTLSFIVKQ
jgi:hypothetical protein